MSRPPHRWLPHSLFGRHLLTLVLLILAGQLLAGLVFQQQVLRPRSERFAEGMVATLSALRAGLAALPAGQRAAFVARYNAARAADDATRPRDREPLHPLMERLLIRHATQALATRGVDARWRHDGARQLFLGLPLEGEVHWLYTPMWRVGEGLSRSALLIWALAVVLALLGAWLLQRRLSRPLDALVDAAARLGQGERPAPLDENGPREIATLSHAFNQMAAELARQEQERHIMLAGVSHDLRTPLAKMRLALEMLDDADPELLASLVNASRRMDAIIDRFMDFSRGGERDETPEACDLPALLRRCADGLIPPPTLELPASLVRPLRPRAFARLVDNLLDNARLYGHAPGEPAQITLRCTPLADGRVEVAVEDRGPGIGAMDAEQLLQPFVRGDAARGGPAGSGLGLAIAARIARLHGAELQLRPRPGGGLCVCLQLPAAAAGQAADAAGTPASAA